MSDPCRGGYSIVSIIIFLITKFVNEVPVFLGIILYEQITPFAYDWYHKYCKLVYM